LFVIGSGVQADSARRVAALLSRPAAALDIWRGEVCSLDELELSGHLAPVTVARMRAVGVAAGRWARATNEGILVAPQDVGLVFRRAIAAARRGGADIALLPDGAVSLQKVTGRGLLAGVVPAVDGVISGLGIVAGRHGRMASSRPDLALSWGSAWNDVFRAHGVGTIIDVGNPRADDCALLPAVSVDGIHKILICSQPMDHGRIGGKPAQTRWFSFMERMATTAPAGDLAIRLHPAERERLAALPIGDAARALLTEQTSLADDIGASDAVVSWASTTMIEAAASGRAVVSVAVNEAAAEVARGYLFQQDPRALAALTDDIADFAALRALTEKARAQQVGMADDFQANVGGAARAAAEALDNWEPARRP
jgi:hypothetical protein